MAKHDPLRCRIDPCKVLPLGRVEILEAESRPPAASRSACSPVPSSAAVRSSSRVADGRREMRAAKIRLSCPPRGRTSGSGTIADRWTSDKARGSSRSPSGLPCAVARTRALTRASSSGNRVVNSSSAAASVSGGTGSTARPDRSKNPQDSVLDAARSPARLSANRRATALSTPALAASNQPTSSTTRSKGTRCAARRQSVATAAERSSRSAVAWAPETIIVPSASLWRASRCRMSSRSGNHLVKPGEGEGTFELCARHPEHARAIMTRPRCRCGEQRGLAHAGFSRHEQRATVTIRDTADDVLQNFSLVPASDQGGACGTGRRHRSTPVRASSGRAVGYHD